MSDHETLVKLNLIKERQKMKLSEVAGENI